jgi:hypothetical protein
MLTPAATVTDITIAVPPGWFAEERQSMIYTR